MDKKPTRPGSSPELLPHAIAGDEQPERRAVRHHPGLDGAEQAPPKRTTLTDLPAARPPERNPTLSGLPAPPAPALPLEYAETKRPAAPWGRTMRAPTPPEVMAQARREPPPLPAVSSEPPPTSIRVPADDTSPASLRKPSPLPEPSRRPEDAQAAARARENERLRNERNEAREAAAAAVARAEAAEAAASVAPPSGETKAVMSDETIGRFVREVTNAVVKKIGLPAVFMAMLGGGGYAMHAASEKPVPPPLTKAELDAALEKLQTHKGGFNDQTRMLNEQLQLTKCLRRKVTQIGESVLPAPDHMGSTRKPQPFEDDCPENPRPMPDP